MLNIKVVSATLKLGVVVEQRVLINEVMYSIHHVSGELLTYLLDQGNEVIVSLSYDVCSTLRGVIL